MRLRFTNRRVIADREFDLSVPVSRLNASQERQCTWSKVQDTIDQTEPRYRLLVHDTSRRSVETYVALLAGDYTEIRRALTDFLQPVNGLQLYAACCTGLDQSVASRESTPR